MVSTPQELAISDVARAINMYKKFNITIFGIIENMSYFQDSSETKHYVFGNSEALHGYSNKNSIPIIAQFPINSDLGKDRNLNKEFQITLTDVLNILTANV